nr:hypothetical protein [Luteitalea pratensis]
MSAATKSAWHACGGWKAGLANGALPVAISRRTTPNENRSLLASNSEVSLALILTDVVDRANVRMIQRRRRARFADEPVDARGLQRHGRQQLERDQPLQPRICGLVHLPHATRAEKFQHAIRSDDLARSQSDCGPARGNGHSWHLSAEAISALDHVDAVLPRTFEHHVLQQSAAFLSEPVGGVDLRIQQPESAHVTGEK